jgi:uncharacterized protein with FMN-binding domain
LGASQASCFSEETHMSIRYSIRLASAAALAVVAAISSAGASGWLPFGSASRPTGEASQAPATPARPAGDGLPPGDQVAPRLAASAGYQDGSFLGPAYNTYYGPVQVRVNIRDGRVVSVDVPEYPADRRASQRINGQALPLLEREVISAQSARVNIVSGATLTCEAYLRSLDAALRDAAGAAPGIRL